MKVFWVVLWVVVAVLWFVDAYLYSTGVITPTVNGTIWDNMVGGLLALIIAMHELNRLSENKVNKIK